MDKLVPGNSVIIATFNSEIDPELITVKQVFDNEKIQYLVLGDRFSSQIRQIDPANLFPIKLHVLPEDEEKAIELLEQIALDYKNNEKKKVIPVCPKCNKSDWKNKYDKFLFLVIKENSKVKLKCKYCGHVLADPN